MKFDPDLLRMLLVYVEEHADRPISQLEEVQLSGYDEANVAYHVLLAHEAGFIAAQIVDEPDQDDPDLSNVGYSIERLTYRGHEFLGNSADPDNWTRIKDVSKKVGAKTADAMFDIAKAIIQQKIQDYFGSAG